MHLIKPKPLKEGDTIAIVSPSWGGPATFPERYRAGKKQLIEEFGIQVIEMPNSLKEADWIHANPKARADDVMEAFSDSKINGIITSIGGDDSIRLLPFLDLEVIKNNPKVFMGYSDTTILHFACLKAGISSFYGPSIMSGFAENGGIFPFMKDALLKTVFSDKPMGTIAKSDQWTVEHLDWGVAENQKIKRTLRTSNGWRCLQGKGSVSGHLIGGCIDVFPMLLGTDLWPEKSLFNNAILFIETSEEAPSTDDVKRIMRNLGVQGILSNLNGILIGRPGGGVEDMHKYDDAILSVVKNEFNLKDIAIISQVDFGHTDPMCVLPYGVQVIINCENTTVAMMDSACI